MRAVAALLIVAAVGFGLTGAFFGRASWIGMNDRSIPVWLVLEAFALVMLIAAIAIRIRVSRG